MIAADDVIRLLGLEPLPQEGGYFAETYRGSLRLPRAVLPPAYGNERSICTSIYYLLTRDTYSAMHRLAGDEIFHFYLGDCVEVLQLHRDGSGDLSYLGNDLSAGHRPQVLVPGGSWQGARLVDGGEFALLGTTMAPGFDFADFSLGNRRELLQQYSRFAHEIEKRTAPDAIQ